VKEKEVYAIPFVAYAQTLLSPNEAEIPSKLQEKALEMPDKRLLHFGFGVFILEP
jgi:hypothetical protein